MISHSGFFHVVFLIEAVFFGFCTCSIGKFCTITNCCISFIAGPGGDLRVYLEGLALAEDVQEYVEQNPFGQKPIIKSDPSWSFYAEVIRNMSKKRRRKRYRKKRNPYLENGVASTSKSVPV